MRKALPICAILAVSAFALANSSGLPLFDSGTGGGRVSISVDTQSCEREKERLENENNSLKAEKQKLTQELSNLKSENQKTKEEEQKLRTENTKLKEEKNNLKTEGDKKDQEIAQLKEENKKLKEENLKLKKEIKDLKDEIKRIRERWKDTCRITKVFEWSFWWGEWYLISPQDMGSFRTVEIANKFPGGIHKNLISSQCATWGNAFVGGYYWDINGKPGNYYYNPRADLLARLRVQYKWSFRKN